MVYVKFFSSLREQLGKHEVELDCATPLTLKQVWQQASGQAELPDSTLCALNAEYARLDTLAQDGDEVAFFPPVTGG